MNAIPKITENVSRFDNAGGAPIGSLSNFHTFEQSNGQLANGWDAQSAQSEQPPKTYEDGLAEGRLHAETQAQDHKDDLAHMLQELRTIGRLIETGHGRVISAMLSAVLPALAKENILVEIKEFLVKTAEPAMCGRVLLQASPALKKDLVAVLGEQKDIASPQPNEPQSTGAGYTLEVDKTITDNKVRAIWKNGGGEIDIDGAVRACLTLLAKHNFGDENDKT